MMTGIAPPWDGHGLLDIDPRSRAVLAMVCGATAGNLDRTRLGDRAAAAAAVTLLALLGGCSTHNVGSAPDVPAASSSSSWSISRFFSGASAKAPQTVAGAPANMNCPSVQIREGASTLTIAPPGQNSTMSLKYQGSFLRAARQCTVVGGNMVMRIGVEGRIIVGPAGGPGEVDVPLRIAVVHETPAGTAPIVTKFIPIPVAVTSTDRPTLFSHIEDAMSFPLPTPTATLYDYKVYVGFDPLTAEMNKQKAKDALRPRRRLRTKQPSRAATKPPAGTD